MIHKLSCHCGALQLEVNAELGEVLECNCSTCGKSGFLSWYVPTDAVRLSTPSCGASTYYWRFATEGFHFCSTCGIATHRTWKDNISVNARCLNDVDIFDLKLKRFNGKYNLPGGAVPPVTDSVQA